uniref:Uncharacterized protein n=1 Tax=Hydrogenophaga sp. PL2G6 TaxID=503997 RepID=B4Y323_9BURK|nr:hypothetical protein [Hydrogenophaga sp. PL2G6]
MPTNNYSPEKKQKRAVAQSYLYPELVIPYCISVAVGLYWPRSGVSLEFINLFMDWMAQTIPSISAYVEKSAFPEVSKAYFTIGFFIFLPTLWLVLRDKDVVMHRELGFEGQWSLIKKDKVAILRVIGALFFTVLLLYILYIQPGYQFKLIPLNESRASLAFFGGLSSWLSVFYTVGLLRNNLVYLSRIVRGGGHEP